MESGRDTKTRQPNIVEEVAAVWKPIVSREEWEGVCAILTDPARRLTVQREPRWLCAGIVRCGACGDVLRSGQGGDRKGSFTVYRCAAKIRQANDGRRHATVKTHDLDPLVREAVVSTFLHAPSIGLPSEVASMAEVYRLQARLGEVRAALSDLIDLVGTPGITAASVLKRTAALGREEEQINASLGEHARRSAHAAMVLGARAALWTQPDHRVSLADAAALKGELAARFEALPLEQRRTLVRSLLTVTVHPWSGGKSIDRVAISSVAAPDLS